MKKNCANCKHLDYDDAGGDYSPSFPVCSKYEVDTAREAAMTEKMQKNDYFYKGKRCCEFVIGKCHGCGEVELDHKLWTGSDKNKYCWECLDPY